mmetsp:Transcript_99113/g.284996  ORF Transcript_99113/g.284996 Transcript_99113/m.284996 type:complete len:318 (-) Transcript_99113:3-956(-)
MLRSNFGRRPPPRRSPSPLRAHGPAVRRRRGVTRLRLLPLVPLFLGPVLITCAAAELILPLAVDVELCVFVQFGVRLVLLGDGLGLLNRLLLEQLCEDLLDAIELLGGQGLLELFQNARAEDGGTILALPFADLLYALLGQAGHISLQRQLNLLEGVDDDDLRLAGSGLNLFLLLVVFLLLRLQLLGLCRVVAAREEVAGEPRVRLLFELTLPQLPLLGSQLRFLLFFLLLLLHLRLRLGLRGGLGSGHLLLLRIGTQTLFPSFLLVVLLLLLLHLLRDGLDINLLVAVVPPHGYLSTDELLPGAGWGNGRFPARMA